MLSSNTSAVSGDTKYIEDYFSSYLYTGTGSAQSIVNNIDLATKGGMLWIKNRSTAHDHILTDTARGVNNYLSSNLTAAQVNDSNFVSSANTNGFSIGTQIRVNATADQYASWSFAKATKFFDVVTYTGTGSSRTVAHSLGSTPGCIIIKRTSGIENWTVYHQAQGANKVGFLNLTNAFGTNNTIWGNTSPTSTVFTVGDADAGTNANGSTYVAYIFAHDAGGFGLTGTDNVISCGSYTLPASGSVFVNLGWEPQWLLIKPVSSGNWQIVDNMRGFTNGNANQPALKPNASDAETTAGIANLYSNGFGRDAFGSAIDYIYIAIRRGPMKVPTDATKVFKPVTYTGAGAGTTVSVGFPPDMQIVTNRDATANGSKVLYDRLRAGGRSDLLTNATDAEVYGPTYNQDFNRLQTQIYSIGSNGYTSSSGKPYISYAFQRASSFFDEVCDTGTGSAHTIAHNLGVTPELIIRKTRSGGSNTDWWVYSSALGATKYLRLNFTSAQDTFSGVWNDTAPTSTNFTVGTYSGVNASAATYVTYLFATCAGVSKVGSFVLSGSDQTIDCGFAAGARFVLIKDTGTAGRSWHVWDTARGIVSGTEPFLDLNNTNAEVTIRDWIDPHASGFTIKAALAGSEGGTGQTFIFLAIA